MPGKLLALNRTSSGVGLRTVGRGLAAELSVQGKAVLWVSQAADGPDPAEWLPRLLEAA